MKLKKLEIKNIASFQDAVIDFDYIPLKNADLVLINGETGSGKSTILDAICLALYADTPRLHNTVTQVGKDEMPEGISFDDPRRLLRTNTGSGYVKLSFEADGKDWLAEWGVRRARDKATGALQSKNWTLTDLSSNKVISKDAEIRSTISRLTGLDFTQFCRTTMLSQGEFAAFLKSKPDEKAAILQKITGVDRFQRIGIKIYAITSEKKQILDKIESQKKALESEEMTPEKRQSLEEERTMHEQKAKEAEAVKERLQSAQKWVDDEAKVCFRLAKMQKDLAQAETALKSEDVANASEQVSVYDSTGDVRAVIAALAKSEKDEAEARKEINGLQPTFTALSGALQILQHDVSATETKLNDIKRGIDEQAELKDIFDSESVIDGECQNLAGWQKEIAVKKKKLDASEADIRDNILPEIKKLSESIQNITDKKQNLQDQLKSREEAFEALDLPGKRKLKDDLVSEGRRLSAVTATVERLETCDREINKLRENIAATDEIITNTSNLLDEDQQAVATAKEVLDTQQEAFDSAQLAAGKSAQEIRARLKIGDVCPVCGHDIQHVLTSDRILRNLARQMKITLDEKKQCYEDARKLQIEHQNTLKLKKEEADKYKEDLKQKTADRTDLEKKLTEVCDALDVKLAEGNDPAILKELLTARETELNDRMAIVDKTLQKGDEINMEIKRLSKDLSKCQTKLDAANIAKEKTDKKKTDADRDVVALKAAIKTTQGNINTSVAKLEEMIGDSKVSGHDFRSKPLAFAGDLKNAASAYKQLLDESTRLTEAIGSLKKAIGSCEGKRAEILTDIPQWKEMPACAPAKADSDKTETGFDQLRSEVIAATAKFSKAAEDCRMLSADIDRFFDSHPEMDRNMVELVAGLSEKAVSDMRSMVQNAHNRANQCQAILKDVRTEYDDILRTKPEWLIADDADQSINRDFVQGEDVAVTPESIHVSELSGNIKEAEGIITESAKQLALIQKMFDDTAKHNEKLEAVIRKLNEASKEYSRWDQLNKLLGDAKGQRFSNIALSHLLDNLIHDANAYMAQLDDRYELAVIPGTFGIMVCDRYQGYLQRTANTLSGGETFLVSLALALALSNIGQLSGCDMLFIDEGFGSLSGGPLDKAINTLKNLHRQDGRRIGIISHITELREKIPTQLIVERAAGAPATIRLLPEI